jgi:molybdopterin-guanine dinucleotide biosynthesis protein A
MILAGLVLAGGRSVRFGREKAMALYDGRPLIEHALDRLQGCLARAVNAPPESGAAEVAERLGLIRIGDAAGDPLGPLSGVKAGLDWARAIGAEALLVVPCDAPRLPMELAVRLIAAVGSADAAYATTGEGPHPLCSLWRPAALPVLRQALAGGAHPRVLDLLAGLKAAPAPFEDAAAFANLNRPEDLQALG